MERRPFTEPSLHIFPRYGLESLSRCSARSFLREKFHEPVETESREAIDKWLEYGPSEALLKLMISGRRFRKYLLTCPSVDFYHAVKFLLLICDDSVERTKCVREFLSEDMTTIHIRVMQVESDFTGQVAVDAFTNTWQALVKRFQELDKIDYDTQTGYLLESLSPIENSEPKTSSVDPVFREVFGLQVSRRVSILFITTTSVTDCTCPLLEDDIILLRVPGHPIKQATVLLTSSSHRVFLVEHDLLHLEKHYFESADVVCITRRSTGLPRLVRNLMLIFKFASCLGKPYSVQHFYAGLHKYFDFQSELETLERTTSGQETCEYVWAQVTSHLTNQERIVILSAERLHEEIKAFFDILDVRQFIKYDISGLMHKAKQQLREFLQLLDFHPGIGAKEGDLLYEIAPSAIARRMRQNIYWTNHYAKLSHISSLGHEMNFRNCLKTGTCDGTHFFPYVQQLLRIIDTKLPEVADMAGSLWLLKLLRTSDLKLQREARSLYCATYADFFGNIGEFLRLRPHVVLAVEGETLLPRELLKLRSIGFTLKIKLDVGLLWQDPDLEVITPATETPQRRNSTGSIDSNVSTTSVESNAEVSLFRKCFYKTKITLQKYAPQNVFFLSHTFTGATAQRKETTILHSISNYLSIFQLPSSIHSFDDATIDDHIHFSTAPERICLFSLSGLKSVEDLCYLYRVTDGAAPLIAVGNFCELLKSECRAIRRFVKNLKDGRFIRPHLIMQCRVHKDSNISFTFDDEAVSDGYISCGQMCEIEFPCKHKCPLTCHNHSTQMICELPCEVAFECGHKCTNKCGEPCDKYCTHPQCVHLRPS